jgi:RNA polymerase sigma-70 factor, ECF subfamily
VNLEPFYLAAREQWPKVNLARDAFDDWVQARGFHLGPSVQRAQELYLACACVRGDAQAHAAFEARYLSALSASLSRFGADRIDEVKQALRERLFLGVRGGPPKLTGFRGDSGLGLWLRMVAARVALNVIRDSGTREPPPPDDDRLGAPLGDEDPRLAYVKRLHREDFKKAFADAMASLSVEGRNYLRLYYLDGLGLEAIAAMFGSSAPTVSRRLAHARSEVQQSTRGLLQARLKLTADELDSLMRLIQSHLTPGPALE